MWEDPPWRKVFSSLSTPEHEELVYSALKLLEAITKFLSKTPGLMEDLILLRSETPSRVPF